MNEKIPHGLSGETNNELNIEINYEAISELINQWFEVSLYRSHLDQNLTQAIEKLWHTYKRALINQRTEITKEFYEELERFENNFGAEKEATKDLRELVSYFL